ncbi:MAG: hypothetical protein ACOH2R_08345 [Pseudomonas sp.]
MISNHTSQIRELRGDADMIASRTAAFLAGGGTIHEAPPPKYSPRPALAVVSKYGVDEARYRTARQAAQEKQALVDKVRDMAKTMTQAEVSEAAGITRKNLSLMGQKHGFGFRSGRGRPSTPGARTDRSQDEIRVERILAFKELGLTRAQAARQLGVNDKLFIRLITEHNVDYPKYVSKPQ